MNDPALDGAFSLVIRFLDRYRPKGMGLDAEADATKIKFIRAELAAMRAWLAANPKAGL